jgi:hypothetical protein
MQTRHPGFFLAAAFGLAALALPACSDENADGGGGGGGGTSATGVGGTGASTFNQCGVAAPLPADTGQCTTVSVPLITNFDDYTGSNASGYSYYVNGKPPAENSLLGAILHVDDGSPTTDGASVITTDMVTGEGDAGYALEVSNTNAVNWGGLVMFYFPYSGSVAACLNGGGYSGIEFSIRGSSPSGRFGINLGMLDTTPVGEHGLCDNPTTADCKDATLELRLPTEATTWTKVRVPWSALTPGIGSSTACVPVTGQNVIRVVIQPFMNYPPPNYTFEPGAYSMAIDNLGFY